MLQATVTLLVREIAVGLIEISPFRRRLYQRSDGVSAALTTYFPAFLTVPVAAWTYQTLTLVRPHENRLVLETLVHKLNDDMAARRGFAARGSRAELLEVPSRELAAQV